MIRLIVTIFILLPVLSWSQQNDITTEEQKIIEMEKKLQARKKALEESKSQTAEQKQLEEIRNKKQELEAKEKELLNNSKKTAKNKTSLRKRDYYFDSSSILFLMFKDKVDFDSGSENELSQNTIRLDAGWNFGRFEIGPIISESTSDRDSYETEESLIGVKGLYNFIENIPGNDWIPFAQLTFATVNFERKKSDAFTDNYTSLTLGGGISYFPFSEFLSIKTRAYYMKSDGSDYTRDGIRFASDFVVYF